MTKKFKIKDWRTGAVIFTAVIAADSSTPTRDAIVRAVAANADLSYADLRSADLRSADLSYANLRYADLRSANLSHADLRSANLRSADLSHADLSHADLRSADLSYANLSYADLSYADLRSANLRYADLRSANLSYANLRYANLCSPTMILLANWGELSPTLCAKAMAYDAACHPNPERFTAWAAGGECPYAEAKIQRACNFTENRELWNPKTKCPRPYDLMVAILAEKCPPKAEEK